ncbi:MAG: hypothetical protein E7137_02455 [Rikenellaceae bacterium]|nr:hypothetical protein [Rikenellaceae bacterium]
MKRALFLIPLLVASMTVAAQDTIVLKDGELLEAKVIKIGESEVEYKKWSNPDGPIYTLKRAHIFTIKYANGEKELFTESAAQRAESNDGVVGFIHKQPAANNQEIIDSYKTPIQFAKSPKEKASKSYFPIMAMSDSSLVSTDDLEMRIVPKRVFDAAYGSGYLVKYAIELKNKSGKTIYIDLANSFRINSDGSSKSYHSSEQTTVSQGSGTGVGIALGGVAIGTSSQNTVSTTFTQERILVIPPYSTKELSEHKYVQLKTNQYKTISDLEAYTFELPEEAPRPNVNGYLSYTEADAPYAVKYIVTYSTQPDFTNYATLQANLYARYLYGGWLYSNGIGQDYVIKFTQQYIANFWIDKGVILGY